MSSAVPEPAQTIAMTAAELDALLEKHTRAVLERGGADLPPGAYREGGRVYRDVYLPAAGRTNPETGIPEQGLRRVQRQVLLVSDPSPGGLAAARRAAYQSSPSMDVYHPEYGWLRYGKKREVDVSENLGSDTTNADVVYLPIGQDLPDAPSEAPAHTGAPAKKAK